MLAAGTPSSRKSWRQSRMRSIIRSAIACAASVERPNSPQRLREFHEENETPVVGLREGAWIRVEGDRATLGGVRGARIFRRGWEPEERRTGESLDDLL